MAVEAYDGENSEHLATGTLVSIDNQIDPSTGTVKLRALFSNTDSALFPNQFVNIRLAVDKVRNALTIPTTALGTDASDSYVFVLANDRRVYSRRVTLESPLQPTFRTSVSQECSATRAARPGA